jgi:hypothetical protein
MVKIWRLIYSANFFHTAVHMNSKTSYNYYISLGNATATASHSAPAVTRIVDWNSTRGVTVCSRFSMLCCSV